MFLSRILNIFFPPVCPACGCRIETDGGVCAQCYSRMHFVPAGSARAASAVYYDNISRKLILSLKYGDRTDLAGLLAKWMVGAGTEVLDGADVLVPVPLHWKRLFVRKYNQAAVLAEAVSKLSGIPADAFILKRIKSTPKQSTREERFKNVRNAFAVFENKSVAGKTIVLIDDVLTTGATAEACAGAMMRRGAKEVRVLTFAKAYYENAAHARRR